MSYSILRVARVKGSSNTKGIQKHNQRENKNYNNKDIDRHDTYKNYDLIHDNKIDYQELIDEKIDANYSGKRKIRSDAIRHVDGLITSDDNFFKNLDEDEIDKFFKDSLEFLEKEYGRENIVYATVHLDEKVPHMHFGFVPLTEDGRLSAKEVIGNKKQMTELQDRFNNHVNDRGHEMERGVSKHLTEREHTQMDQYKIKTLYHQTEYEFTKAEYDELEDKTERLKGQLTKDLERLKQSAMFNFEDEKQIEKNLFGKVVNEQDTGRKIISSDDYERLEERLFSATRILDDYEELTNQDIYKENEKLKKENEWEKNRAQDWMNKFLSHDSKVDDLKRENDELTEKNKGLNDFSKSMVRNTTGIYRALRSRYKSFEGVYDNFAESLSQKERTEPLGRFMKEIQGAVKEQDRKRSRSNDFEL